MRAIQFIRDEFQYTKITLNKFRFRFKLIVNLILIFLTIFIMTITLPRNNIIEMVERIGFIFTKPYHISDINFLFLYMSDYLLALIILSIIFAYLSLLKFIPKLFFNKILIYPNKIPNIFSSTNYTYFILILIAILFIIICCQSHSVLDIIIKIIYILILVIVFPVKASYKIFFFIFLCFFNLELILQLGNYNFEKYIFKINSNFDLSIYIFIILSISYSLTKKIILFEHKHSDSRKAEIKSSYLKNNSDNLNLLKLKQELSIYVFKQNRYNLKLTILIYLSITVLFYIALRIYVIKEQIEKSLPFEDFILNFIIYSFAIIFIRFISRAIEIGYSFYQDIIENKKLTKSTFLSGPNRINLAIYSIIEMVFLSSLLKSLYYIYNIDNLNKFQIDTLNVLNLISETSQIFIIHLLESFALGLFNYSFPSIEEITNVGGFLIYTVHLIQLLVSLILITLSIANYLNIPKYHIEYNIEKDSNNFYNVVKYVISSNLITSKYILKSVNIDSIDQQSKKLYEKGSLNEDELFKILECCSSYKKSSSI